MLHKLQNSLVITCRKSQHRPLLIAEETDPKDGLGPVKISIIYIYIYIYIYIIYIYICTLGLETPYKNATSLFILLHRH